MRFHLFQAILCGLLATLPLCGTEALLQKDSEFELLNRKEAGAGGYTTGSDNGTQWIGWQNSPGAIEARLKLAAPEIARFERGEFTLTVRPENAVTLRRIVLRVVDRTGETFQYTCPDSGNFPAKTITLTYPVGPEVTPNSVWGGNNDKKLDWPIRFSGFAVDFTGKNDPGKIFIESATFRAFGERVTFRLDTGHPLNLLLPGHKTSPEFILSNPGTEPANLSGTIKLSDVDGEIRTDRVQAKLEPGEEQRIALSGDFTLQGYWRIESSIQSSSTGREYQNEFRFGRIIPAGPTPERAEEFLFGVCSHPERFPAQDGELEALAAGLCGIKIVRVDFAWSRIQPKKDAFDFSVYDRLVDAFGRNGVEMQALLGYSTPWAVPKDYRPKNPEKQGQPLPDATAYGVFCGAVADRYKDRIRYFEFWNEPDLLSFANFSAEDYMTLMRSGYNAIKKVAPNSRLMNGGIASVYTNNSGRDTHNNGLFELLLADQGKHFDLFAFHGHGPYRNYVEQLDILEKYGLITPEQPWGWYSNETAQSSADVGEKVQSETLFRKLIHSWARGAMGFNWYNLREKSYYPLGHHERHFGLITAEFEPKPVYITYNMLANTYRGAKFLRSLPLGSGIQAELFQDAAQRGVLALWSDIGDRTMLFSDLPEGTVRIDLYGNETPIPIKNGLSYLKLSGSPFSLRFPSAPPESIGVPGELFSRPFSRQIMLEPGTGYDLSVPLINPTKLPLELTIELQTPESIHCDRPAHRITLRPGEKQELRLRLTATESFRATPVAPTRLGLRVQPNGLPAETLFFPAVRKNADNSLKFRLDRAEQYHSLVESAPGNERFYWKNPDDLSADIALARSGSTLILKVNVRDDVHVQPYNGTSIWQGDSVQFGLRLPNQERLWKLGLAHLADGNSTTYCWSRPSGFSDTTTSIQLKTERDEEKKLTSYEAKIPFKTIGLTPEIAAAGIRFNLIVNDNDGDRREGFLALAPGLGIADEDGLYPVINLE